MFETNSCVILIKQIHDELEKRANNVLRASDLTMAQITALLVLRKSAEKQMPMKELERALRVAQSTASGVVSRLEQKGFVEALDDLEDKRVKVIRITSEGEQCCLSADRDMEKTENNLLSGLTETERDILFSLLEKIHNSLQ